MRGESEEPAVFAVGPAEAGGMGRLLVATERQWRRAGLRPRMCLVDSYGRKQARYFARALAAVGWNGVRRRIAVLHVHMAMHGSVVRKSAIIGLGALLRVPIVLHLHGSRLDELYPTGLPFTRGLLHGALRRARVVVVPGQYWRDVLVDRVGVDADDIRIIASGVPGPDHLVPRAGVGPCRLAFLGALAHVKGLGDLLSALGGAELRSLPWRLRVAGPGDPAPFVEQCRALGIAERVEFLGLIPEDEVQQLLAETDIFVQPSHSEGLSIAMLEAMSHGCAVVATPVGATPDAVAEGESALLVAPRDVPRLGAALVRLVTDSELRATLQAGARRRWERSFQIATHCRALSELYREVAGARMEDGGRRTED